LWMSWWTFGFWRHGVRLNHCRPDAAFCYGRFETPLFEAAGTSWVPLHFSVGLGEPHGYLLRRTGHPSVRQRWTPTWRSSPL
jgi:hypothetical protein